MNDIIDMIINKMGEHFWAGKKVENQIKLISNILLMFFRSYSMIIAISKKYKAFLYIKDLKCAWVMNECKWNRFLNNMNFCLKTPSLSFPLRVWQTPIKIELLPSKNLCNRVKHQSTIPKETVIMSLPPHLGLSFQIINKAITVNIPIPYS